MVRATNNNLYFARVVTIMLLATVLKIALNADSTCVNHLFFIRSTCGQVGSPFNAKSEWLFHCLLEISSKSNDNNWYSRLLIKKKITSNLDLLV